MQTAAQKSHPLSHTDAVTDKSQGSGIVLQFQSPCSLASDATFFSPVCTSSYILLLLKTWGIRNRKQGRMRKVCNSPKDRQHDKGQHGLGLYKLKKIADSYNGMIILDNKISDGKQLVCFEVRV